MTCVDEFHQAFGLPRPVAPPVEVDPDLVRLRMRLLREEFEEAMIEMAKLVHAKSYDEALPIYRDLLKELCDVRYVTEGAAVSLGLPIEEAYAEVHASNMSKLGEDGLPIYREDGKVLKGPGYFPAEMEQFVPNPTEVENELCESVSASARI